VTWLLFFALPLALWLSWLHPRKWVPIDARAFVADGSADSLLGKFHRQRFTIRAAVGVGISLLAAAPLSGHWRSLVLLALAVGAWQAGYWLYYFNPALNVARNLPYVGKYHVSWNPSASLLDRYVWRKASAQVHPGQVPPDHEDALVVAIAGPLYQRLLRTCLLLATAAALLLSGWAYLSY
jgi:hypothetical protein